MEALRKILAQCTSTFFLGLAIQIFLSLVFFAFFSDWPKYSNLLINPDLDFELRRLIPGAVQRSVIGIGLSCVVMSAFYFFQWRRTPKLSAGQFAIAICFSLVFYLVVVFRTLQFSVCVDDAYIDFRYVYKWVNGLGFDYNSGERLMGFTSAFHLAMLSLFALCFDKNDIALVSQMVNAALQAASYLLLYVTVRKALDSELLALFSASIFAFNPINLAHCISGKEAPLVMFVTLVSVFAALHGRMRLLAWSAAISALARPEGAIWLLACLFYDAAGKGRDREMIRRWIAPIGLVAVFYLLTFFYFGSIVPHGAKAKAVMFSGTMAADNHAAFYILKYAGFDTVNQTIARLLSPNLEFEIAWAIQGAIVFLLLFELSRRHKWLRLYAGATAGVLLFFAYFDPFMFSWYYGWFALIAPLVVPVLVRQLAGPIRSLLPYPSLAMTAVLACLVSFNALLAQLPPARLLSANEKGVAAVLWPILTTVRAYPFAWNEDQDRLSLYKKAAEYIAARGTQGGLVAAWEPGVVGFVLPRERILDLSGIVSAEPLKFYPVPNGQRSRLKVLGSIPPDSVKTLQPEWCLFLDSFADNGLMADEEFLSRYEFEKFWLGPVMGSRGLYVFRRVADQS